MVEIDDDDAEGMPIALHARHLLRAALHQAAPVGHPGERIGGGEDEQARVELVVAQQEKVDRSQSRADAGRAQGIEARVAGLADQIGLRRSDDQCDAPEDQDRGESEDGRAHHQMGTAAAGEIEEQIAAHQSEENDVEAADGQQASIEIEGEAAVVDDTGQTEREQRSDRRTVERPLQQAAHREVEETGADRRQSEVADLRDQRRVAVDNQDCDGAEGDGQIGAGIQVQGSADRGRIAEVDDEGSDRSAEQDERHYDQQRGYFIHGTIIVPPHAIVVHNAGEPNSALALG